MNNADLFGRLTVGRSHRSVSDTVRHDIVSLLNASLRGMDLGLSKNDPAYVSVFNYGRPPLSNAVAGRVDPVKLVAYIRQVLLDFEPRIDAGSLKLNFLPETDQAAKRCLYMDLSSRLKGASDVLRFRFYLDYLSSMFFLAEGNA